VRHESPPEPALKMVPTRGETEAAYRAWVEQHKGQRPPSRDKDEMHMRGLFPRISRKRVRDLRRELAPEKWTQHGRPRKTGSENSAEKSDLPVLPV
jgi:hypothetical protein